MLKIKKHVHVLACGGIGMSALCLLMLKKGMSVSGSDLKKTPLIDELILKGLKFIDEKELLDPSTDLVIYSSAIGLDHPQHHEAKQKDIQCLHRIEALHLLMDGKKALLVAGTHGKTTTSSVLTHVLKELGQKPSYAVGGTLSFDGPHADYDEGLYFVAEADESDGSFLKLSPFGLIVTNIDQDHMDYWQTREKLEEGFKEFMSLCQDKNFCIYCGDDPILAQMGVIGTTYGSQDQTHFRLVFDQALDEGREFLILDHDRVLYKSNIPLNGHHNALNALAVFSLLRRLGFEAEAILKALSTFKGVDRRCQIKGQILGSVWIDDYGHHPTEIKATLEGLIDKYPNKSLCVIFQPHRFSRTFDLWNEFHKAFSTNYRLIVTDIYGCQEENPHGLSAEKLVIKIKEALKGPVEYVQRDLLSSLSFQEEIVVTFGAGDITHLYDETLCQLT